jgi:hypothetical protein
MPNPYILDAPQMQGQDPQGLSPVFQNANAQQQFMNSQLGQGNQLGQYQNYGQSNGGSNALALAQALRKEQGTPATGQTTNYFGKVVNDPTYGAGTAYNNMTPDETANMMKFGL